MKNPIWLLAALLIGTASVSAETAMSSFEVTYPYYDKNTTCTQEMIDVLPLTLKFDRYMDDHILLISSETNGAHLTHPLQFSKEGLDGYIAYMSTGSTKLMVADAPETQAQAYTLQQLWLQKAKRRDSVLLSGFYLGNDRDCLVMNDPTVSKEYPGESGLGSRNQLR